MASDGPIVVFDLETQRSADEVGGWGNIRDMLMSVAVTWNSDDGTFRRYEETEVSSLLDELNSAGLIVGFNVLRFDYEVLSAYTRQPLRRLPTVDMLAHLHRKLGFRVSLDNVAGATLNLRKSGDGLDALRWWREGRIDQLFTYCEQDVEVTRRVFEFGRQNGYVRIADRRSGKRTVRVRW